MEFDEPDVEEPEFFMKQAQRQSRITKIFLRITLGNKISLKLYLSFLNL